MKKFLFFAAALFAAVSFAACSDDDDENVGGGGGTPTYYVSRIERFRDSDETSDGSTRHLEYDEQNRLIASEQWSFNYVGNKVICNRGVSQDDYWSYILNDKGYATQTIDGKYKFEYDSNDHLLQLKCDYSFPFYEYYTWENGDLIKTQGNYDSKEYTETFTYYDYINNQNLWIDDIFGDEEYLDRIFLGRRNKHLLKSVKWEEYDGSFDYYTYEYELDSKGRPVTIYEESTNSYGHTKRSIYKLSYK